jgi:4-hydroxy-4-methyl-2-oxoglutarate aldolase
MTGPKLDPKLTTKTDIQRVTPQEVEAARTLPTATLHEAAGKIGALPSIIKPVAPGMVVCGPALTVHCPPGDNLWIHRAMYYAAQKGDVLVVSVSEAYEHGYWGEVMSTAALALGLGGMVIDGCVRDSALLAEMGFPIFSRGLCIRGTGKDFGARGWINAPVRFADITVEAGDLIVGDADGVVAIPRSRVSDVIEEAKKREAHEADIMEHLKTG